MSAEVRRSARSRPRNTASAGPAAARARDDAAVAAEERGRRRPRSGAKRTLMDTIRLIPRYLKLLAGLLTDARVAGIDKLLVAGAIAYIVLPLDILPDFIPFVGQVDDIYLLVVALERLISNAGRAVLADHWTGPASALSPDSLRSTLVAASFFLPRRVRRRLRAIGR